MEGEPVVEQVPNPCEALEQRARGLLFHVDGEFEDEDGDSANGFILADPIPSCYIRSLFDGVGRCKRKHKLEETGLNSNGNRSDACFACSLCGEDVALQELAHPALTCACLFCKACLSSYARYMIGRNSMVSSSSSSSSSKKVEARGLSHSSVFIDLTASETSSPVECIPCPTPSCKGQMPVTELQLLAPDSFLKWEEAASEAFLQRSSAFIKCPGCQVMIEKVKSEIPTGLAPSGVPEVDRTLPYTELDNEGKTLSRSAMLHKAVNRFRCILCGLDFCGACLLSPYHLGKTCEEIKAAQAAVKCIYCARALVEPEVEVIKSIKEIRRDLEREGVDASWCVEKSELMAVQSLLKQVCEGQDCRKRLTEACTRILHCGHRCGGVRGERQCLPCLEEGCKPSSSTKNIPCGDELCGICLVEELHFAPAIQLRCGHVVHLHCAKAQIRNGCPGPEITFGYLKCTQCKQPMEHPRLEASLRGGLQTMELIRAKIAKRMKMEGVRPPDDLTSAMEQYRYYNCNTCRRPYFGGVRNCQAAAEGEHRRAYDPSELVCGGCSAGPSKRCNRGHDNEFIEFKCRYCCSPSTFFCFGRTHFCNKCHVERPDMTGQPLAACKGPRLCPLGMEHPPNGQEFCLGCLLCRLRDE